MGHCKLAPIAAICCMALLQLQAQTGDWEAVKQLRPGTPISVVKQGRQECELIKVNDRELTCERDIHRVATILVFARDDVRQVRLECPEQHHMFAGILAGAAAGALIGFEAFKNASDPEARGYGRAYSVPIGAIIGGAIGHNFHRHGAIVYQRR